MNVRVDRKFLSPVLLISLFLLFACATTTDIRPPDFSLNHVGYGSMDLTGVTVAVGFNVMNPNPRAIDVLSMDYTLDINGYQVGKGRATANGGGIDFREPDSLPRWLAWLERAAPGETRSTIPAMQDKMFRGGFKVSYLNVPMAVKAVFSENAVRARLRGNYMVATGRGKFREYPFDSAADVPISMDFWTK